MDLQVRVLGRVDALVDGGSLALGGSKQRAVLAILALHANRTVAAEELIDGLWGERPPASAAKNVQLYVSRLRKALGAHGAGARIVTRGRGYELQLPDDAVDAARFERLVERARREADEGIVDGAAESALELWRGPPLADVAEEPFAAAEIRHLEELHLHATELAIDAELAAGRHDEAIGELSPLIAEHPLNERFHAQRMLALYRAGRQSEALDAYREARRTLIDELGIEPGLELRRLEQAILRQDPALDPPAPRVELPRQLEGGSPLLAGRERELRWLQKRWQEAAMGRARITLVSGPSGIGKTRLGAELAAEVQRRGATVLYVAGSGPPDAALETVRGAIDSERPTLLVLDDADDAAPGLLEAAAALATDPRDSPLLVLALHRDEQGPPAFAELERTGAAQRLALGRLRADAIAEIAALYAPGDGDAIPLETLIAESDGVALRVHRAASAWGQAQAAERLVATVGRASGERGGLQAAEAEVAGSVTDLEVARQRTRLYLVDEPADPSALEICPFRGLAPFDAAHAEYFFGRERLVARLVARFVGSTLLAVVGPSGSGKSSALRAGLLPALASGVLPGSERWPQVLMRPGDHPLAELGRILGQLAPDGEPWEEDPVAAALDSLPADEPLVLAVDQLEEVFVACRDEAERTAFLNALAAAADDPDRRVVVVAAIRADFYGRCADYRALAAQMSANQVLVGPMRREELRRAIELPARRAGLRVEPGLVSALVGDVAEEPGGLPLLSTTLVELWEERSGRALRRAAYDEGGGVSGAVSRLAERAYLRLSEPQREAARAILLRLADAEAPAPVRRRVPLSELEVGRDDDRARALAVLTESRLVTVDEGSVEVAHEALLREWPRLRDWLADDAEGRRLHQHLTHAAREWQASGRDLAELYRGARLAAALDWAAAHDPELNELEREFLDESRAASERAAERQRQANRRLRLLLGGVGLLLVAAVLAGVVALSERQGARSAATVADAQRLGAQALTEERLDQALRLAGAGVALDDSVATRSNLLSTLLRSPAALGVLRGDGDEFTAIAASPDGRTLTVGDRGGTVRLFDAETRELVGEHQAPGPVWALAFDPRGDSLALAGTVVPGEDTGSLEILDASSGQMRTSASLGPHPAAAGSQYYTALAYAPDGRSLIVTYSGGDVGMGTPTFLRRYDASSAAPLGKPVRVTPRSTTTVPRMSPDGHLLVSTDEATYAIDAETLRVDRRYPLGAGTAALSHDGRWLATDGGLRLLDLASGRVRTLAGRQDRELEPGAFSPDGRTLSASEEGGNVILFDVAKGVRIQALAGHSAASGGAHAFSSDGRTLYTASDDSSLIAWDVAGDRGLGRSFPTGLRGEGPESYPPSFALSPDGQTLAVARLDGRVELIDAETLRRTASFEAFPGRVAAAIEYSPDGRWLAVAGEGGGVGIWDVGSDERIGALLRAPGGPRAQNPRNVQALAFGQDDLLAAAGVGGAVRIWDLNRRELVRPPLRLPLFVLGLAFSPDGSQLAIPFGALLDEGPQGVEVLDVESGERVTRLSSDVGVRSVAFSPDGGLLAGGQVDGAALLWATEDWRQVGEPLTLRGGMALGLAFAVDGRTLTTSHDDGAVVLWDVASQEPIGSPLPAGMSADWDYAWVTARFTPDGARLFAVTDIGRAIRWEIDPAVWREHACAVAGGGLTPEQWAEIVPEQEYISACPEG